MATEAQFNFMDGGERAPGNVAYYAPLGISVPQQAAVISGKYMFSALGDESAGWVLGAFSSVAGYFGNLLFLDGWENQTISLENSAGQAQISLRFNNNGSISVTSGSNTLGSTAPFLININTVFFLETYFKIDSATGAVTMVLNGNPTPIFSVTGVGTAANTGNLPVTQFGYSLAPANVHLYFRDIYIHDGTGAAPFDTFLGPGGCEYLPPIANVAAQFTPNGNTNNYQNAAETPPNPTVDYNSSSTVGQSDTFTIAPLPSNVQRVFGVKLFDYSYKNDTGSRALQKSLKSGAASAIGTENYLNMTAVVTEDIFVVDPNTGALFTPAAVNALTIGYEVVA
jgi:hypothetical protein